MTPWRKVTGVDRGFCPPHECLFSGTFFHFYYLFIFGYFTRFLLPGTLPGLACPPTACVQLRVDLDLFLLFAENISALPLACLPSQPVQAVEGGSATLQCRLDPPVDLSSTTVEWNRGHTRYVHVYRSRRDDPDSQMLQYRERTALNRGDLSRGVSTLTISNVSLSDNGSYEVYLPQRGVRCSTHLTVATKEQEKQTKRKDSSSTSPPAGERNDASNREAGRAALVPTVLLILVLVVLLVLKSGKIPSCKKEGEPKTSEGDQQSAAEEGLVGSEVTDINHHIRSIKGSIKAEQTFLYPLTNIGLGHQSK